MIYRVKIKHNVPDKVLNATLIYDDGNSEPEFPPVPITLTDTYQYVNLIGWEPGENGIDKEKIKISLDNPESTTDDKLYVINNFNVDITLNSAQADQETIDEELEKDVPYDDENTKQKEIVENYSRLHHTGDWNVALGEKICSDNTKFFYDYTPCIDLNYEFLNERVRRAARQQSEMSEEEYITRYGYSQAEIEAERGTAVRNGAFICQKTPSGYTGRISYGSIYFSCVLIEANSQYARFMAYEKSSIASQSINEEGDKKGVTMYGRLDRNYRCCDVDIKIPTKTNTVINFYNEGQPESDESDILTIAIAPDFTAASTGYKAATADFYINGTKIATGEMSVRVRLQKGVQYNIEAKNIKFNDQSGNNSSSNWQTLGRHKVTLPLYSDNILKIVAFNKDHIHGNVRCQYDNINDGKPFGLYENLFIQAYNNLWGLPRNMFYNEDLPEDLRSNS